MSKEILHISHHIGCFRDQHYILDKLGFEVTNHKFYDGTFKITKEIADNFWNDHKDQLNEFDYILTSDTAPLSRIFLENQDEFKSKLIIWICNRFDYNMEDQTKFYELFSKAEENPNIKIVPYTYFEKIWCKEKGTNIMDRQHIPPCGINLPQFEQYMPSSKVYDSNYGKKVDIPDADVIVPIYHNDNRFFNMTEYLTQKGINVYNGGFRFIEQLKKYKAFVTMPDAFSKFLCFELIHSKIPVILPSKDFLYQLSKKPNYFFNIWGSGGANLLQKEWIDWCEWYDPNLNECRFYFDSFEEIPEIIKSIDKESMEVSFENASKYIESKSINLWKNFYSEF
jgi:hypothetical protein